MAAREVGRGGVERRNRASLTIIDACLAEGADDEESTTKDTKDTKNSGFGGNTPAATPSVSKVS